MPSQSWVQEIASQLQAGTLLNTYTTAKSVINPEAIATLPAKFFDKPGKSITVKASGGLSNIVTTPGTVTLQVMLGAVVVFTTGAVQLNATAHTLLPWWFEVELRCDTVGATTTAKLIGSNGRLGGIMFTLTAGQVDAVNTPGVFPVPVTAPAVGTGFDSTAAQTLDFWAGFSISNSGNGIQVYNYSVISNN